MGTVIQQTKFEALPAGVYRAKVGAVALEDGTFGPQLKFRFDLLDGEEAGKSVNAWASPKLSAGKKPSKLYGWVGALLFAGKALPEEYTLDTDDLLDREGLIVLDIQEKEAGTFNRVSSILPLRRNGSKAWAPAPATSAPTNAQPPAGQARAAAGVVVNTGAATPGEVPPWLAGAENDGEEMPF